MYVFLLVLGAVISAAGIVLLASGVSFQEHAFNFATVTPGAVAVIGGLILIGLGLTVHVLKQIERALTARPVPRSARFVEAAADTAAIAQSGAAPPMPYSNKPTTESHPPPAPADDAAVARLREKFPTLVRLDNAPVVEETDVSLLPKAPVRADENGVDINHAVVPQRTNGAAVAPQLEVNARASRPAERAKVSMFDTLWPKGPRSGRQVQTAAAPAPAPANEPAPAVHPAVAEAAAAAPVSILKSGVVDGMAYTLYSDGSIEAQLPQGTLRFGSITELRNHIEHSA